MMDEIRLAIDELHQAEENFRFAEPDFITAAAYEVAAKREKLNALIKMAKRREYDVSGYKTRDCKAY